MVLFLVPIIELYWRTIKRTIYWVLEVLERPLERFQKLPPEMQKGKKIIKGLFQIVLQCCQLWLFHVINFASLNKIGNTECAYFKIIFTSSSVTLVKLLLLQTSVSTKWTSKNLGMLKMTEKVTIGRKYETKALRQGFTPMLVFQYVIGLVEAYKHENGNYKLHFALVLFT